MESRLQMEVSMDSEKVPNNLPTAKKRGGSGHDMDLKFTID